MSNSIKTKIINSSSSKSQVTNKKSLPKGGVNSSPSLNHLNANNIKRMVLASELSQAKQVFESRQGNLSSSKTILGCTPELNASITDEKILSLFSPQSKSGVNYSNLTGKMQEIQAKITAAVNANTITPAEGDAFEASAKKMMNLAVLIIGMVYQQENAQFSVLSKSASASTQLELDEGLLSDTESTVSSLIAQNSQAAEFANAVSQAKSAEEKQQQQLKKDWLVDFFKSCIDVLLVGLSAVFAQALLPLTLSLAASSTVQVAAIASAIDTTQSVINLINSGSITNIGQLNGVLGEANKVLTNIGKVVEDAEDVSKLVTIVCQVLMVVVMIAATPVCPSLVIQAESMIVSIVKQIVDLGANIALQVNPNNQTAEKVEQDTNKIADLVSITHIIANVFGVIGAAIFKAVDPSLANKKIGGIYGNESYTKLVFNIIDTLSLVVTNIVLMKSVGGKAAMEADGKVATDKVTTENNKQAQSKPTSEVNNSNSRSVEGGSDVHGNASDAVANSGNSSNNAAAQEQANDSENRNNNETNAIPNVADVANPQVAAPEVSEISGNQEQNSAGQTLENQIEDNGLRKDIKKENEKADELEKEKSALNNDLNNAIENVSPGGKFYDSIMKNNPEFAKDINKYAAHLNLIQSLVSSSQITDSAMANIIKTDISIGYKLFENLQNMINALQSSNQHIVTGQISAIGRSIQGDETEVNDLFDEVGQVLQSINKTLDKIFQAKIF